MKMKVRMPSENEKLTAQSWPIWTKEISVFPWHYNERETCLILAGQATVIDTEGNSITFGPGNWVEFEEGVSCTWTISSPIRKHYYFG